MRLWTVVAVALLLGNAPAFANECPGLMTEVEEYLAFDDSLSNNDVAMLENSLAEAQSLHNAGRHKESSDLLIDMLMWLEP
jgi:hypothetical protein